MSLQTAHLYVSVNAFSSQTIQRHVTLQLIIFLIDPNGALKQFGNH